MRKKLLALIFLLVAFMIPLSACSDKNNEHLSYFETEKFTAESFKEAVKLYGKQGQITDNQAEASYKNPTVKPLLTSEYYDICSNENIGIAKLWSYLVKDLFAENITFTVDSLVSTIKKYCVWTASTHYLISECEYTISKNPSVKEICQNKGAEFFNALVTKEYKFYEDDIIDLFKSTESWSTNCSIAYTNSITQKTYPLFFEDSFWWNNGKYVSGYKFNTSEIYSDIVSCIKNRLRDPDSYSDNGNIEFYSAKEPTIKNGMYSSSIYVKVPIRAKNGFGGYGNATYWLTFNWERFYVSWYGETKPIEADSYPFETCYL